MQLPGASAKPNPPSSPWGKCIGIGIGVGVGVDTPRRDRLERKSAPTHPLGAGSNIVSPWLDSEPRIADAIPTKYFNGFGMVPSIDAARHGDAILDWARHPISHHSDEVGPGVRTGRRWSRVTWDLHSLSAVDRGRHWPSCPPHGGAARMCKGLPEAVTTSRLQAVSSRL